MNDAMDGQFPPEVLDRISRTRTARESLRAQDPAFFAAVSQAMFNHDLVGINFETNTDEYDAEAGSVIPRLAECSSAEDIAVVLHEEFRAWFGSENAGTKASYAKLAEDIWSLTKSRGA